MHVVDPMAPTRTAPHRLEPRRFNAPGLESAGAHQAASGMWARRHPYAMATGGTSAPKYVRNAPGFSGLARKAVPHIAPPVRSSYAPVPREVALAKPPVARRAKIGDSWYPVDSNGNVRNAPPIKVNGRLAPPPRYGPATRASTGIPSTANHEFVSGLIRGGLGQGVGHLLGTQQLGLAAHELAHGELLPWNSPTHREEAQWKRDSDISEVVDTATLKGLAPLTVMAAAHGHVPNIGDFLWDATLFGGPFSEAARGARVAIRGREAVEAADAARAARRAQEIGQNAARARGELPYQHPTDAWVEAAEARRSAKQDSREARLLQNALKKHQLRGGRR